MDEFSDNGDGVVKGRAWRSSAPWAALIEAWGRSGQSIAAFCRERGLGASSFYGWRRRLSGASAASPADGGFVRLGVSSLAAVPEAVVVRFADGVELRAGGERLAELVMLLRGQA